MTLYELICKEHPYPGKSPSMSVALIHPHQTEYGKDLSGDLCNFLLKGVQPKAADRFSTAHEMEAALERALQGEIYQTQPRIETPGLSISITPEEQQRPDYNPFVTRLRRLFSQAQHSNAGTRGLDEIARKTYIETQLDLKLVPAILNGEFRLVIITGNAGDGKTALIQQLEERATNLQALPSKNGSRFEIYGIPFHTNYDGSQDEGAKDNDTVLEEFLSPFAGLKDFSQAPEGRILAINEGRLMEFLSAESRKDRFGYLYEAVDEYFTNRGEMKAAGYKPSVSNSSADIPAQNGFATRAEDSMLPHQMIVVNLNWRLVVAEMNGQPSILEKQLKALLKEECWAPCQRCQWMERCVILHNAEALGDPVAGPEIRARLARIFEVVHLRRELHMTMRDLRSALSFLICRDLGCEDVAQLLEDLINDDQRLNYAALAYWNITDDTSTDSANEDRLIRLIRQIDVGQVARPSADRDLHFRPLDPRSFLQMGEQDATSNFTTTILADLRQQMLEKIPAERGLADRSLIRRLQRMLIRKFYFEGKDPTIRIRLPYQNFEAFQQILNRDTEETSRTLRSLVHAVSLGEGCRNPKLAQKHICLAASGEKDPRYAIFRLFPRSDFSIEVRELGSLGIYLEHTPDRFVLQHRQHPEIALEVNLDLFELMSYVARGFNPSQNDLYGHYTELVIFKNMLQNLPYRSVLLTEDHQHFYQIRADEGNTLFMEKV